jgi:hypothetical protein
MEDAVNSITSVNTVLVGVVISLYFNSSNVTSSDNRSIEMKAVIATVISILLLMGAPFAFAQSGGLLSKHSQADYQSGLKHGVIDGKDNCIDRCHWYVLELGHGFAPQSKEFSMGYVRGFCSVSPKSSSDADQASWDCAKGPTSASWVSDK